MIINVNLTTLI